MKYQLKLVEEESNALIPQYQQFSQMNLQLCQEFSQIQTVSNESAYVETNAKLTQIRTEEVRFESIISTHRKSQETMYNAFVMRERFLLTRVRMMIGRILFVRLAVPMVEFYHKKKSEILITFKEQHSAMFGDAWKTVYAQTKSRIRTRSTNARVLKEAKQEEEKREEKKIVVVREEKA